ncbi:(2Fe-2S)-binding protein [Brevibacillus choshinensis]|uniref:(2Fe-2S)-binding protein n=1 Tax=Brevibacillus choshinensis TaxID=54911 RepID=UPI002E23C378|nr:(2Fe-2S)-binding protein [Brevibacillus choshinensis]MED4753075.1 (2Fe-2S)-binding protein [Brevibacillus choshinensis]MED4781348.1 (2Fe-2S)-binding protein [Brevibacillus choshinensis]
MMTTNFRLTCADPVEKQQPVSFTFNGQHLEGYAGEPIAVALLANGIKTIRTCEVTAQPRGVYCGIGHCYECRAEVDGVSHVRTCLTPLRGGTTVSSLSSWQIEGAGR